MAHEVSINLHTKLVQNKDVEIEIKKDGSKLGDLLISRGNIEWVPSGNSVNKHRMSWAKFSEFMEEHGKKVRKD